MLVQDEVTEHGIEACNELSLAYFSLAEQREVKN